ncbi:MAG: phosphate ABC transporter permease PstA [Verrucomicrobiota bacterium]
MTDDSATSPKAKPIARTRPIGEGRVWLCGLGLALGIAMIVFLLGLILVKGVAVFWPKPVSAITFTQQSADAPGGIPEIAGEIVKKQPRNDGKGLEWQIFTGNKDAYGSSFRFINADTIKSTALSEDLIVAERMEYGDSIFVPVEIKLADGTVIPAASPDFESQLASLVREAGQRRKNIFKLEKRQIGAINADIQRNQRSIRKLDLNENLTDTERTQGQEKYQTNIQKLEQDYQALAKQSRALREEQKADTLTYRLLSGEERTNAIGDLVSFYYPNRLTFFGRLGVALKHSWTFLSDNPREANTEGGIFPAIFGTFVMTLIMSVIVAPFGVIAAIYLREYARQGLLVRSVRISVNNLAGVPSIVFGVFGLGFFVYFVGGTIDSVFFQANEGPTYGTGGIFWASLTLALMTLPVVIVATEEALAAVPRGIREAALACGASKWQMTQRVVLPSATPGVLTGIILAMARGAGEVAPLMLVGVVKLADSLPLDTIAPYVHPERKFMHLGFHIYDLGFQSPDSEAAKPMVFATTLLLIVLVVVMNLAAIQLRNHLKKKYTVGTF